MHLFLFSLLIFAGLLNFASSILILRGLSRQGVKVSFFEIRWQIHKHLKTYRERCRTANGRVDWPYTAYWISLAMMLAAAAALFAGLAETAPSA